MSLAGYHDIIASSRGAFKPTGFTGSFDLPSSLFPHQRASVEFSLLCGASAMFLDTGLGKTRAALAWGQEIIRQVHEDEGWIYHSRVTIWKSPVVEMTRTKAHGLLYKTLRTDGSRVRVGMPDYLLVFRKPAEGKTPEPVTHDSSDYPVSWWQEAASPVWMTVDQTNVLNVAIARDDKDERHLCPLQLDVIERAVHLWSNKDEVIYSPFMGIGSEGYIAIKHGRRFIGTELKDTYFRQAVLNLNLAEDTGTTGDLVSQMAAA